MSSNRSMMEDRLYRETEDRSASTAGFSACAVGCLALGAGLMYMLDPDRGRRRRAVARDKLLRAFYRFEDAACKTGQDLVHRGQGLVAETRSAFSREQPSDQVLVARVRSRIGRVVSHPHAIRVTAFDGVVRLGGPILADEARELLWNVKAIPGVRDVESNLQCHKHPAKVPDLQGGRQRPGERFELMQENWSPGARLLVGFGGVLLSAYGFARRNLVGTALGLTGAGLLVRAASNLQTKRLVGIGAGRRAIDIQKTININAPVEDVFGFWRNYDNFPLFMHNVREVRDLGHGRSRWRIAGPAGAPIEFDAVITQFRENELISWKSEPGSMIGSAGIVRFSRNVDGSCRIDIRMTYNPVAGAVGHVVAALFGADPKHEMDQDLARLKTLIETGNFPHDAAKSPAAVL